MQDILVCHRKRCSHNVRGWDWFFIFFETQKEQKLLLRISFGPFVG